MPEDLHGPPYTQIPRDEDCFEDEHMMSPMASQQFTEVPPTPPDKLVETIIKLDGKFRPVLYKPGEGLAKASILKGKLSHYAGWLCLTLIEI